MQFAMSMDRRALLERIVLLAGVAALPAGCKDLSDGPGDGEFRLEKAQFEALGAIADTIVPKGDSVGALDAEVPKKFEDLLRQWASEDTREGLVGAIEAVDEAAQDAHGKTFADLDGAARLELLDRLDQEGLKQVERPEEESANPIMAGPAYADPGYARMRQLIVALFYYSELALTQELEYVHNPGRWDPSVPVTAKTRQTGGLTML